MKKHFYLSVFLCLLSFSVFAESLTPGFYNSANGLKDGALKDALKSLIRDHTAIPYGSGASSTWGVFFYSDRNDEGYMMDMYCDEWSYVSNPGDVASGCNIEHSFAKSWWGGAKNGGYAIMLSDRWNLDLGAGVWGGGKLYTVYACPICGVKTDAGTKAFILPDVRIAIQMIF